MKKYGIFALVLILIVSLSACGKRNKEQDNTTPSTDANPAATATDPTVTNPTVTDPTVTDPVIIDPTIMDPLPETNIPDPNVDTSTPEMD